MLNTLIQEFSVKKLNTFLRSKMSSYATENEGLDYIFNDDLYEKYESVIKLGEAKVGNDDLIVIASKTNEALTEKTGKKNQYDIAKKVLKEEFADASLFVFYDDEGNFRFSFVKANYISKKREFTEFKRYTYYVSKEQTNRTFIEQIEKCTFDSLENILEAFSVEKLNEAFFDEYKRQFVKLWTYLNTKEKYRVLFKANDTEKSIRDFTKKLLGRFVFLYFLQKKKWLGCSAQSSGWKDGKLDFLKKLYETYEKKDYFHSKCLTQLFFNTLNIKRENDLFAVEGLSNELNNTKIPYLNGGLFEEDREADAYKIDFPKEYFEELIAFFEQYNFTIDENSPDDHDIGIDPEMLGHIFENLLEDNKDKGAFYTPKEIVQYMTQESLIAYLKTHLGEHEEIENFIRKQDKGDKNDKQNFIYNNAQKIEELLDNVKVCDPAIGSGAFPMGILQEILRAKTTLDWTLDRTKAKKQIIQNSIYGVDLEAGAVDIARLRFWLSLVVEEDTPQALPNLDYKIMQGNSLISRYELDTPINDVFKELNAKAKQGGEFKNPHIERLIVENPMDLQKFKQLTNDYLNESDVEKKKEFRALINEIKNSFITEFGKEETKKISKARGLVSNLQFVDVFGKVKGTKTEIKKAKAKLKKLEEHKQDTLNNATYKDAFEWRFEFPNLLDEEGNFEGFDIVIGNPPYVSAVSMRRNQEVKDYFKKRYPLISGSYDLYTLFLLQGKNLLNNKGIYSWIIPNKFLIADYAKNTRNYLVENGLSSSLNVSSFNVFKGVGVYPIILLGNVLGKKQELIEYYLKEYSDLKLNNLTPVETLPNYKTLKDFNVKINSGSTGFQAKTVKEYVIEENSENTIPFTVSGNVDRYIYNNKLVKYMKDTYSNAFIQYNNEISESKWNFWRSPKIVVAGMTKEIEAVFVKSPLALGVGIYGIYDFGGVEPYALTGILNSKYLTYYFKNKFKDKHLAGGYLAINKSTIEQFPLIKPKNELPFTVLSHYVHSLKVNKNIHNKHVPNSHISETFEEIIDALVFELYFPKEFKKAGIEISKYAEQEFEDITDKTEEEKLAIIQATYQGLTEKKNPLRNQIKLMKIELKELLNPILSV